MSKRDQESDCHCTVYALSSLFCREDFLFIVMDLHSVNYLMKRIFFLEERTQRSRCNYVEETEALITCAKACAISKSVPNGA